MTRLEGVTQTKLRIARETRLEVFTRDGNWLEPEKLLDQIARGRFDARRSDVLVTLTGRVHFASEQLYLELPIGGELPLRFSLEADPKRKHRETRFDEIGALNGQSIEVTGRWRAAAGGRPARILVRSWKTVSETKPADLSGT